MSENSDRTVVLASPGKIGFEAQVRVLDWAARRHTRDGAPARALAEALAGKGVQVVVAG